MTKTQKPKYYNVFDDIEKYPDAWLYECHSMRGPGKTYGFLKGAIDRGHKFIYMKRNANDVELIAKDEYNPFNPINRDNKTDYKIDLLESGLGRVSDSSGEVYGLVVALSVVHKFKGFSTNFDPVYICFDEYIPQLSERVRRREGDILLDFYMTIARDRYERLGEDLKLILFGNPVTLVCPITESLGIVDSLEMMERKNIEYYYDDYKLLHRLQFSASVSDESRFVQTMKDTQWGHMALQGEFSYNDSSKVMEKYNLNNSVPIIRLIYNKKSYYIYRNMKNGTYYMTTKKQMNKGKELDLQRNRTYNLDVETEQRRFYIDHQIYLRNEITEGRFYFETYRLYNLIYNYKKNFENL